MNRKTEASAAAKTAGKTATKKPVHRVSHGPSGEVRLIGGKWKRTKLKVADRPGLRPTPDRVRETLFNWLGQDLSGWKCVDAFAGTGALGFEAASRGAKSVQMFESDAELITQLKSSRARLEANEVSIDKTDGITALKRCTPQTLDLVFLDPPFESGLFDSAVDAAAQAIAANGFVYLEAPVAWTDEQLLPRRLTVHRYMKAGSVHAHLLTPLPSPAPQTGPTSADQPA